MDMKTLCTGLLALILSTAASAQNTLDIESIRRMAASGDVSAALEQLDDLIAADSNDIQARFFKGLLLNEQGDSEAAKAVFAEMARLFPRLPESFNNLAAIYAEEGKYEQARQALLSAAANSPDYAAVRSNLGDLYIKLAVDAYRKALEIDPNDQASAAKLRLLEQLFGSGG